ncbi:3-octaprenyl-4-hydroxybenzoate carboxy-lyase [Halalkalicoccus paucihalophilus]|uniref:3-octaprenyl-4-hydroxybenzoate carboxy-lyase n=1 Tax=Halalkalicoccus paucihalophilus TaxID=1008153 RepID=A0A151A802_9EURY|nr:UbiD family decarboxylase [Halalkalicoccus paucihalophilus]KYH23826.1 3-octaprenyl-4-hydroxybenzoate carboxy-lyase [Halalkalicoccus paucihalophilus]
MISFRDHLRILDANEDLLTVTEHVHWDEETAAVAVEALKHDCKGLRFTSTSGEVDLASGIYAGHAQISSRTHQPWRRLKKALDREGDDYVQLLEAVSRRNTRAPDHIVLEEPAATIKSSSNPASLGLPTVEPNGRQLITLGLIAVEHEGMTSWAPVRGAIHRRSQLRLSVPQPFIEWCGDNRQASISLGIAAAPLVTALQGWTLDRTTSAVPKLAAALGETAVVDIDGRTVPADAEVRLDGSIIDVNDGVSGPVAVWERGCETVGVTVEVEAIATREDPVVPFIPLGAPLTDDLHLTALVEAAELYRRINGYWGVSPVSWIRLPVEGRLGICLVSSEILYSGFEWQLANVLFSFSDFFDKVLILDEHTEPDDLARALDDMWVKAHPSNDWIFSDPNAPAASIPRYRRDGQTGSRLYINATWDPQWDEEYIAPRVTFQNSYPEDVRELSLEKWSDLNLEEKSDD